VITITVVIAVLGLLCTGVSVYVGWRAHKVSMQDRSAEAAGKEITNHIDVSLQPVKDRLLLIEQRTGPTADERNRLIMTGMIHDALNPLSETMTKLGVKVDTLWSQLAVSMAQILHQPDPARRPVDRLLEALMEGTLSNEERTELRKYLAAIKNWEPGSGEANVELGPDNTFSFPVHNGEQVAAGILLLTMDDNPRSGTGAY
jgi:hypothetical protein